MTDVRARVRRSGTVIGGLALVALAACADPGTPDTDDPTDPAPSSTGAPDATVEEVRTTLGTIEPCGLLEGGAVVAPFAVGPHTCEAQLDDARVRVEVGVPVTDELTADAERTEVVGLVAYTATDGCSTVFPVGPGHGVSVSVAARCAELPRAADLVGAALAAPDVDARRRPVGPDAHTACGLLAAGTADPTLLVDAAGDRLQGLDHCELDSGPELARTGLSISYRSARFGRLARLLKGERVEVAGQDAVVVEGEAGCYVHTYLWGTEAEGRGSVSAEGVVRAADCQEARDVTATVVDAVLTEPAEPGSVADLLADSQ